ncbi:E3 ubiquitin-protein ligase sinah, partial [Asbolus verrucosus]
HSSCSLCWELNFCPICKVPFTDTRNFCLESISELVHYPCENENKGCHRFFTLQEMQEHLQICDFRTYGCKLDEHCDWEGRRHELKKHYLDKHDNKVLIGKECTCLWKYDKPDQAVHLMLAYNERFYVHRKLKNDIMYWAVQYIGQTEDVIMFYFEINIFSDQFTDRKLEFSEICHDDIKDMDEIIDTGFCVAVPMNVLETYINTQDAIFYKIIIKTA